MKKILLGFFLAVLLSVSMANAATVNVSFDDTLDFTAIHGFGFNIVGISIDDVTLNIITTATNGGAVPGGLWDIYKSSSNNSIDAYDLTWGNFNLSPGLALTLTTEDKPITLSDFYLSDSNYADGVYRLPFTVLEKITAEGVNYTYSAVPVPSSIIIFGFGICALLGIKRKKSNG